MSQSGVSPVLEQLEQMIISDEWVGRDETPHGHPQLVKTRLVNLLSLFVIVQEKINDSPTWEGHLSPHLL